MGGRKKRKESPRSDDRGQFYSVAAARAALAVAALVAFFLVVMAVGIWVVGQDAADERLDGVVRETAYTAVDLDARHAQRLHRAGADTAADERLHAALCKELRKRSCPAPAVLMTSDETTSPFSMSYSLKRSVCPKCWKIISSSSYVTATFMLGLLSFGYYIKYALDRFVKHKIC